jgi:chromosome segregation protein
MEELAQSLRATDERGWRSRRDLQPRRDKLTELQPKEQAARTAAEQFAQQLAEAHADGRAGAS